MAFKGITFAGQNVTPKNDGGLYNAHYGDGVLWGCGMSVSGDNLVIQSGEFIQCGRVIHVDGSTNVDLSGRQNSTGYIQVIMNADMTQSEGSQWYTSFVEQATTTFPALTTDDINDTGNLYQLQLAVVQVSGGNLTSVYSSLTRSGMSSGNNIEIYGNGARRMVRFTNNNSVVGGLRYNSVTGYTEAGSFNSDTTLKAGIRGSSEAEVYADNDDIRFRPKGAGDSTNEVSIDTSGQIHGGHQVLTSDKTTSTNLTANTWSSAICTVTLTPGVWVLTGTANIKCLGTSSTNWAIINIGHSTASNTARSSAILSGSTSVYLGLNASLIIEVTASTYTMDLYAQAEANTSVSSAYLRAVQIG